MATTHTYTLRTYNAKGELIAEVSVSCSCPIGSDHAGENRP